MREYRAIDLFAGIGGIRLGFDQAFDGAMKTVFVSELDGNAQKTYLANFGKEIDIAGDITIVPESSVPGFDICLAGFPCQAFSRAGNGMGFEDDYMGRARGTLFFDVVRVCDEHSPSVIFCENVKGLVFHDKGRTFNTILDTLSKMGYTAYYKVLNSRGFGVPQNRERVYIVAFRDDIDSARFAFPTESSEEGNILDIMEEDPVHAKYYISKRYMDTMEERTRRNRSKGNGFGCDVRPVSGVSNAVVCGGMGIERNLIIDERQRDLFSNAGRRGPANENYVRKMTPREWARLQGFPDSFVLPVADTHLYKQLGNSVTVPVIKAIASSIREVLINNDA